MVVSATNLVPCLVTFQPTVAASAIPFAFTELFFTQPIVKPMDLSTANQTLSQRPVPAATSDELAADHPMFRWNRGKYDRRQAKQRREHAQRLRETVVNSTLFVVSTLALAVMFVSVGIH